MHLRHHSNNCFDIRGCNIWKGSTTSIEENKLQNNDDKNKLRDNNDENNDDKQERLHDNKKKPTGCTTPPTTANSTSRYGIDIVDDKFDQKYRFDIVIYIGKMSKKNNNQLQGAH